MKVVHPEPKPVLSTATLICLLVALGMSAERAESMDDSTKVPKLMIWVKSIRKVSSTRRFDETTSNSNSDCYSDSDCDSNNGSRTVSYTHLTLPTN